MNTNTFLLPTPKWQLFTYFQKFTKTSPGRPIINGIDSITEPASKYIDFHIKSLTEPLDAYLQDTSHVIRILGEMNYSSDYILATIDVESLYTHTDHTEGLQALHYYLQKRSVCQPPTDFIVNLTRWTLNNNIFLFQDKIYRQTKGTAMGASYAPNYAGLYLGQWEERYISSPTNPYKPLLFLALSNSLRTFISISTQPTPTSNSAWTTALHPSTSWTS